eukprot:1194029-Prorocentrum_minimum.AAC.2
MRGLSCEGKLSPTLQNPTGSRDRALTGAHKKKIENVVQRAVRAVNSNCGLWAKTHAAISSHGGPRCVITHLWAHIQWCFQPSCKVTAPAVESVESGLALHAYYRPSALACKGSCTLMTSTPRRPRQLL